jgi:hypothetical protein
MRVTLEMRPGSSALVRASEDGIYVARAEGGPVTAIYGEEQASARAPVPWVPW